MTHSLDNVNELREILVEELRSRDSHGVGNGVNFRYTIEYLQDMDNSAASLRDKMIVQAALSAMRRAVLREREECAKIADVEGVCMYPLDTALSKDWIAATKKVADAIRSRTTDTPAGEE